MRRERKWQVESADYLKVARRLEAVILASAHSVVSDSKMRSVYVVQTATDRVEGQGRIEDVQAHLSNAPIKRARWHYNPKNFSIDYWFGLYLDDRFNDDDRLEVTVTIAAPEGVAGAGFIEQTYNRINAEIARQDADGWNAEPLHALQAKTDPTSGSASASPAAVERKSLGHRLFNHPMTVAIIGGIIATVIGALIVAYLLHQH